MAKEGFEQPVSEPRQRLPSVCAKTGSPFQAGTRRVILETGILKNCQFSFGARPLGLS
jgi:hypothetical protein